MSLPILYSFRRCPYAIRARLAVLASGMTCELREVSLAKKPEAMLIASPKATIPVLVLTDGTVLEESLDIMHHALALYDPDAWLKPAMSPAMELVTRNDDVFKHHLDRYKYPDRFDQDAKFHRNAGFDVLSDLNRLLEQHRFLTSEHCSIVDIAILPFVRQFAAVDEGWFSAQPVGALHLWLADFLASERFHVAMTTWRIWQPGDPVTRFPAVPHAT